MTEISRPVRSQRPQKNDLSQGLGLVAEVVCQRAGWLEPTPAVTSH
jgi:hypothetical protein